MVNMKSVIIIFGLLAIFAAGQALDSKSQIIKPDPPYRNIRGRGVAIEEREAAPTKHRSGILNILEKVVEVMQVILGFADGHNTLDDIVSAVQKWFNAVQGLANVKGIIREVPMIGPTLAWIISPILDVLSALVQNTPVFGGLLSQFLVGPDYPTQIES